MQKTKLGMSVGLLAAIMYFSGLVNSLVLFALAGYILLQEENEWLRKTAIKAMTVVAVFGACLGALSVADSVIDIINGVISLLPGVRFRLPLLPDVLSIIRTLVRGIQTLLLVLLGVRALSQGTFNVSTIDGLVDKHTK